MLRIIAGEFGRRRIRVVEGEAVRPTPDRVREAVFSTIRHEVEGATVLDAYAGSGALGLEALSRGASHVTFIEADRNVASVLAANIRSLGIVDRTELILGEVGSVLAGEWPGRRFTLVLADPPYAAHPGPALLELLSRPSILAPGALVAVERESAMEPSNPVESTLHQEKSRKYGRVAIDYYRFQADSVAS